MEAASVAHHNLPPPAPPSSTVLHLSHTAACGWNCPRSRVSSSPSRSSPSPLWTGHQWCRSPRKVRGWDFKPVDPGNIFFIFLFLKIWTFGSSPVFVLHCCMCWRSPLTCSIQDLKNRIWSEGGGWTGI